MSTVYISDKAIIEAGVNQRTDSGAFKRGVRRRHVLVEKAIPSFDDANSDAVARQSLHHGDDLFSFATTKACQRLVEWQKPRLARARASSIRRNSLVVSSAATLG